MKLTASPGQLSDFRRNDEATRVPEGLVREAAAATNGRGKEIPNGARKYRRLVLHGAAARRFHGEEDEDAD
jgi:hypothetical protein